MVGIVILTLLLLVLFISDRMKRNSDEILTNFEFTHKGKKYWYSRSVACTSFVFCKNTLGKWCVLANRRGAGTPDFQGYWNVICGYLDFNENGEMCAQREVKEETGVEIPIEKIKFQFVNTDPSSNRQNVSLHYSVVLDDICENYTFSTANSEKDEVSAIKWIPIDELNRYEWAFNHEPLIKKMFDRIK